MIDATCPLVAKVHAEVRRFAGRGATVLLVGHADHDEVIGTRGEAPDAVILVEDIADAETVEVPDPSNVALTTQTTLSIDDTTAIVEVLKRRFPALVGPKSSDICYATQNRQDAVRVGGRRRRRPGAGGGLAQLLELDADGRGGPRRRVATPT